MTENATIPQPPKDLVEAVRRSRGPTGDMVDLAAQATRLDRSLAVALKWMEAAGAKSAEPGAMFFHAEYTYDKIEEELSRVCFEMELASRRRVDKSFREQFESAGKGAEYEERPEPEARADALSDSLLEAYCLLREVPEDVVGEKRERYRLMGALLAAMDVLKEK